MPASINRRRFLKAAGWGAAALALTPGRLPRAAAPPRKPNFVFFLIDDLGWKDVGFMGSRYYETPRIDQLAREGMVFTDAYANAPNCAPTRACLMSGQYGPRHGIFTVGSSARGRTELRKLIPVENNTVLDPKTVTLAEALKPAGYLSANFGKWHLGDAPDAGPLEQGFDVNGGGNHAGHPPSYFSPYKNKDLTDGPKGEYLTDRLTDEALKFIEANQERPFFLYFPHYAVHTPIQAKQELTAKYENKPPDGEQKNAKYAAMIASVDESVGRVLQKLDELKLANDTVVIFFSDNGGVGGITSMAPLRGSKGMLYEGGIREPLIVRWPGKVAAGAKCGTPVIGLDFYPTLLELAGAEKPKGQILDGVSLVPLLRQTAALDREALYWHFPAYLEGYTERHGPWRTTPAGAIRLGDYKLIEFFDEGELELYNLKDDIGETKNLAKTMPDKVKELHDALRAWRKKTNAPVPTQRNPKYDPNFKPAPKKRTA